MSSAERWQAASEARLRRGDAAAPWLPRRRAEAASAGAPHHRGSAPAFKRSAPSSSPLHHSYRPHSSDQLGRAFHPLLRQAGSRSHRLTGRTARGTNALGTLNPNTATQLTKRTRPPSSVNGGSLVSTARHLSTARVKDGAEQARQISVTGSFSLKLVFPQTPSTPPKHLNSV